LAVLGSELRALNLSELYHLTMLSTPKKNLFSNSVGKMDIYMQQNEVIPQINSKWMNVLNLRAKTIKKKKKNP
jgi:hypothetical protein